MTKTTKGTLMPEERHRLLHMRPSLLFRERRRIAQQELDEGVAEVLDFEILRAWDMNGCAPLCCPHIYLFRVDEKEYLYAESWTAFNYLDAEFPKREIEIVRSPITKRILTARPEGEVLPLEDGPFDPATEYFSFSGNSECEILRTDEMSEEVRSVLKAT